MIQTKTISATDAIRRISVTINTPQTVDRINGNLDFSLLFSVI